MKSKTQKIVILLILGLVFPLILNYNFRLSNDFKHKVDKPRTSATYDYIIIDALATTNTTYYGNWSWARAQPWCTTGDGTKEYPYIIEDVTIIYPPAIDCLTIRNSRKYFIVRNCTLKDIPVASFAGIRLDNVTNANIIDNISYNNTVGIYLDHCYNNTISGNVVSNNSLGIYLYFCDNNTISGNTANYNDDGMYLEESYSNTLSGNTANGNSQNGIYSYFCDYNNITENTVNDNYDGIKMDISSDNNFIGGNTANDNTRAGIYSTNSDYNNITGNTASDNNNGIFLEDQNDNNIITGNHFNNNDVGIEIYYSDFNTIVENIADNNDNYGISLEGSENNTISRNQANNNIIYGLYLHTNSQNNTITGNTVNNNTQHGIYLSVCHYNLITGNTVNNNTQHGIYLSVCHYNLIARNKINDNLGNGIRLFGDEGGCHDNNITDNILYNNNAGIYFDDNCYDNNITKNIIYNNTLGIIFDHSFCDSNSLYENFFLGNGKHAEDWGTNNNWNTTVIGNYWDNLTSPDTSPQDGIVDTPYTFISGPAGSIDYLPIAEDGVPIITINSPKQGGRFGNTAPTFSITVTDIQVISMWYTLDGGLHNYTFTGSIGTIAPVAWDTMSDGTITITFYALDIAGNIGTAEITIGKNLPEEFDPTLVIVIVSIVGGAALLGAILFILEKRGKISLEKIKKLSFRKN